MKSLIHFAAVASAALTIAALAPAARGQTSPGYHRVAATLRHVAEGGRAAYFPRGEYAGAYAPVAEANCHPSRASLLVHLVQESKVDPMQQRVPRAQVTALRARMTHAERREAAQQFRIQANYEKFQKQQARKEQRIAARERQRAAPFAEESSPLPARLVAAR